MNIWIDLLHTPQYNFYRNFIVRLSQSNTVFVTVLNRGKLPVIVKRELAAYANVHIDIVGNHHFSKASAILDANLKRLWHLYRWSKNKNIDIAFSNAFHAALIGKIRHFKTYTFDDDPQTSDYKLKILFSKQSSYCIYELPNGYSISNKVKVLPVLKEWAYLSPDIFQPDKSVLNEYNLQPNGYFFFREVSVGTVNYKGQAPDSILHIAHLIPQNIPVLLSLEKKDKYQEYPQNWILLQEPIKDIHSLIYFSKGLISSGDSMAREAALLGVPSYYLGIRYSMPANAAAAKVGSLDNEQTMDFGEWISQRLRTEVTINDKEEVRKIIKEKFIDINQYMIDLIFSNEAVS